MEYNDSIEKSAEYLRQVLPLMTRHAAGLHPISYAVWYEYVSGINPALRKHIDELTSKGQRLDDEAIYGLYRNHIAEIDSTVANRVSQGFEKVMADISASTAQAADEAGQFGEALERWSSNYATGKLAPSLSHGVGDLLHHSKEMQQTVMALNSRLEESRREVEELRKEVHRAREEAMIDGLTGLANRRGFDIALSSHFAQSDANTTSLCLLIADIDHFKNINDTYGHLFGDKVICSIAAVLRNSVKGNDLAARYGGEEFVVILPDTPIQGALVLAEKIRKVVESCHIRRTGSNEIVASVTISLGVASRRPDESDQQLIARADEALYKSKLNGRNRVTLSDSEQCNNSSGAH